MIVCSHCQFENPVHHRYCQRCGEPLLKNEPQQTIQDDEGFQTSAVIAPTLTSAESDTMESDAAVSYRDSVDTTDLSQKTMNSSSSDDTVTTQTLLAIVAQSPSHSLQQQAPQHLDSGKRYRLITEITSDVTGDSLEVIVIDTQPNTSSYYQGLRIQATEESTPTTSTPTNIAVPLVTRVETSHGDGDTKPLPLNTGSVSGPSLNIPLFSTEAPSALNSATFQPPSQPTSSQGTSSPKIGTYIALQDLLYPSFPTVQDAWDDDGTIVILENRDLLEHLEDVVTQPTVVPPQILHWCHEMTEIWEVLNTHACCKSILTLDNVRVDEDHILCLRRLYFDPAPNHYSLKDLGILWQTLFTQNDLALKQCPEALMEICQDLATCSIADLETLRRRLEIAADQIHHNALANLVPPNETPAPSENDVWAPSASVENLDLNNDVDEPNLLTSPTETNPIEPNQTENPNISEVGFAGELIESTDQSFNIGDDPTVVLPMQLHTLANSGLTNIGIQRDHNEDFFSMDTTIHTSDTPAGRICRAKGLYILCDGMGGHAAGEVASAAAGDSLTAFFQSHWLDELPDESTIHDAIIAANQHIYDQNQADASEGSRRMGTTLVMLLIQDTKAAIAHVGDSRIYRFTRRQGLEQLTVDHEVGQREIARGVSPDIAYARPDAYQLTQALGPRDQDFIRPDIQFLDMNEDALFILGSDGLTDNELLETYCESHISPLISSNANLEEETHNLIDLANQVNGHDNITVLLVRIKLRPKLSMLGR